MKTNQNASIRLHIILIAVLGGTGFLLYLIFNIYAAENIEENNRQIYDIKYPNIKKASSLEHKLKEIRDSLSNVIHLGNELFLEDTDLISLEFLTDIRHIANTDPSTLQQARTIEEHFTAYYSEARALTLNLLENPDDASDYSQQAESVNTSHTTLTEMLGAFIRSQQNDFSNALTQMEEVIQRNNLIGILLGLLTIAGLFVVAITASLKVIHLINRSDKLKEEFLSTMSHELRTPMNGIMGSLELLKNTPLNDEQSELLQAAKLSSSSINISIDDILTFSDFMSGKPKIRQRFFAFEPSLASLLKEIRSNASKNDLEFEVNFNNVTEFEIESDDQKLRHVIRHVLSNAIKFTLHGKVTLELSIRVMSPSSRKGMLLISVTDTGCGVPQNQIEEIFEPFRQLDGSFQRDHQGFGLGLAMCKAIANAMGGSITFNNRIDTPGSIVTLTIPVRLKACEKAAVVTEPIKEAQTSQSPPLAPKSDTPTIIQPNCIKNIMVVEDNKVNQLVIKGLLKRLGFKSVVADNGLDALDCLTKNEVSLILMDCQMPVMDGFEATRRIRTLSPPLKDIPIIAVTANTMEGDRERCLEAGMNHYLKKPVDIEDLKSSISEQLLNKELT